MSDLTATDLRIHPSAALANSQEWFGNVRTHVVSVRQGSTLIGDGAQSAGPSFMKGAQISAPD